jgi:hypothetical protein
LWSEVDLERSRVVDRWRLVVAETFDFACDRCGQIAADNPARQRLASRDEQDEPEGKLKDDHRRHLRDA